MKRFRAWTPEQVMLLPRSVEEFVPPGHVAHFVRELFLEELELEELLAKYGEERGQPPYDPRMMAALVMYAYCQGVYSSRRIARSCRERVDFMAVTGMQFPDFRTVSDFRKKHLEQLTKIYGAVLKLCVREKLISLTHVAVDGTVVQANASIYQSMSYKRIKETEARYERQIREWFEEAEKLDAEEDREHGDLSGDETPDWMKTKMGRLERIRQVKGEMEAEAKRQAEQGVPSWKETGNHLHPKTDGDRPREKTQRNFTDGDSKILKTKSGFLQGYNCHLAVDSKAQIIVAHDVFNEPNDAPFLGVLLDGIERNLGRPAIEISADRGFCSEANLESLGRRRIRGYIATERTRGPARVRKKALRQRPLTQMMRARLRRGGYRSRYRLRKQTVEPVFGQMKEARSFRRFSLRGRDRVRGEWALLCTAHNLLKLAALKN